MRSVGRGGARHGQQPVPNEAASGFGSARTAGRIHLRGVAERPAGIDEQIGGVFRRMRAMTGRSAAEIAQALGTSAPTIELLEAGAVRALPPWPETERLVRAYAGQLGLDARPLVDRLASQIAPPSVSVAHAATQAPISANLEDGPDIPTMPTPGGAARRNRHRRRVRRAFLAVTAPMAIAGLVVWTAQVQPPALVATVNALPAAIGRPIRSGLDYILLQSAPRRDGLRWIEVEDPRARKSDRLPVSAR